MDRMRLQVVGFEPALEKKDDGEEREFVNVHFVTSLSPSDFLELKSKTRAWGFDVEIKKG